MLVDANVLLYAVDTDSPFHESARDWLETALNGTRRVGIPWQSLTPVHRDRLAQSSPALIGAQSPQCRWH